MQIPVCTYCEYKKTHQQNNSATRFLRQFGNRFCFRHFLDLNLLEIIKVSLNHSGTYFLDYPIAYFLNHPIACFPNIQLPFTKSCSSKWQQNVAGGSITKIHKHLHLKIKFQKLLNILFENTKLLYLQHLLLEKCKNAAPRFGFLF